MTEKKKQPVTFKFINYKEVEKILAQYPDKRSTTLPLLHLAQSQEGYINSAVISTIAEITETHPAEVRDCVSFYTMFYTEPKGRHLIQVCQTLSCSLNGADNYVDFISKKYNIIPGETTPDGKFTLIKVECLGSCGTAPVIQINDEYHEGLTKKQLEEILNNLP